MLTTYKLTVSNDAMCDIVMVKSLMISCFYVLLVSYDDVIICFDDIVVSDVTETTQISNDVTPMLP